MQIVQQATTRPHRCAVIPYLGNAAASGFIDTGQWLDQEHVYVSFEGAAELAKLIGWAPPSAVRSLQAELSAKQAKIDQLEAEVKEADKFAESAEYTLAKFGAKVQKKPGRPKKEPATQKAD